MTTVDRFLSETETELATVAETAALADAEQHLDPATPGLTPGQMQLQALARSRRAELPSIQADERRRASARKEAVERDLARIAAKQPVTVPDSVRRRRVLPFEYLALIAVSVAELLALRPPLETLLQFAEGSTEGLLLAVVLTAGAAYLGHEAGNAYVEADVARSSEVAQRARRRAKQFTLGVLLIAATAITARVYTASILEGRVDPSAVGGYVAFQVAFATMAVVLSWSHRRRVSEADTLRLQLYTSMLEHERDLLTGFLANVQKRQRDQRRMLGAYTVAALRQYQRVLVMNHPNESARVRWQNRFADDGAADVDPDWDAGSGEPMDEPSTGADVTADTPEDTAEDTGAAHGAHGDADAPADVVHADDTPPRDTAAHADEDRNAHRAIQLDLLDEGEIDTDLIEAILG